MCYGSISHKDKRTLHLHACQECLGTGAATFVTTDEVVIFFQVLVFFKFICQKSDTAAAIVCTPLL